MTNPCLSMGKDWLVIYFYMWSSSFKVFSILEKTKRRLLFHNTWQWYKIQIPAFMKVFFLTLWPHCIAYGILIPWWRIEPLPSILEVWSLNHWASREVSQHPCKFYWHTAILTWNIIHGGFCMTRTGLDSYESYEALCRKSLPTCVPISPDPSPLPTKSGVATSWLQMRAKGYLQREETHLQRPPRTPQLPEAFPAGCLLQRKPVQNQGCPSGISTRLRV